MIMVIKTFEGKGWSVRKNSSGRNIRNFPTRNDALQFGVELAVKERTVIYVHKSNGQVDFHLTFK